MWTCHFLSLPVTSWFHPFWSASVLISLFMNFTKTCCETREKWGCTWALSQSGTKCSSDEMTMWTVTFFFQLTWPFTDRRLSVVHLKETKCGKINLNKWLPGLGTVSVLSSRSVLTVVWIRIQSFEASNLGINCVLSVRDDEFEMCWAALRSTETLTTAWLIKIVWFSWATAQAVQGWFAVNLMRSLKDSKGVDSLFSFLLNRGAIYSN